MGSSPTTGTRKQGIPFGVPCFLLWWDEKRAPRVPPQGGSLGSNMPVACCISERRVPPPAPGNRASLLGCPVFYCGGTRNELRGCRRKAAPSGATCRWHVALARGESHHRHQETGSPVRLSWLLLSQIERRPVRDAFLMQYDVVIPGRNAPGLTGPSCVSRAAGQARPAATRPATSSRRPGRTRPRWAA